MNKKYLNCIYLILEKNPMENNISTVSKVNIQKAWI